MEQNIAYINRKAENSVEEQFLLRWSPRAFSGEPISENEILSLLEAARWSPSSMNEQPWLYIYGITQPERDCFLEILNESNKEWAIRAGAFLALFARKNFLRNDTLNRHAEFDAGASWMSLALQAQFSGLYVHAMGGFSPEKAYSLLRVPSDKFSAMCIIAVGRKGDSALLSEKHLKSEAPNTRKAVSDFSRKGTYE